MYELLARAGAGACPPWNLAPEPGSCELGTTATWWRHIRVITPRFILLVLFFWRKALGYEVSEHVGRERKWWMSGREGEVGQFPELHDFGLYRSAITSLKCFEFPQYQMHSKWENHKIHQRQYINNLYCMWFGFFCFTFSPFRCHVAFNEPIYQSELKGRWQLPASTCPPLNTEKV